MKSYHGDMDDMEPCVQPVKPCDVVCEQLLELLCDVQWRRVLLSDDQVSSTLVGRERQVLEEEQKQNHH